MINLNDQGEDIACTELPDLLCDMLVSKEELLLDYRGRGYGWVCQRYKGRLKKQGGLTVFKLEEGVILSCIDRDTRLSPAHILWWRWNEI